MATTIAPQNRVAAMRLIKLARDERQRMNGLASRTPTIGRRDEFDSGEPLDDFARDLVDDRDRMAKVANTRRTHA
jgi:hypothetical protein